MRQPNHVLVIGGGAAGMMAAHAAAVQGAEVSILERGNRLGYKLSLTGKGRCNLTNHCSAAQVLQNVPRNPKFLYSAMKQFPPENVISFFEDLGLPLKTERGRRVFPVSDQASDVVDTLLRTLEKDGVRFLFGRAFQLMIQSNKVIGVQLENGQNIFADHIVLATGGCSYPHTGSTGDGYNLAGAAGHTVIPARASLVPMAAQGNDCARMQGLTLKNIAVCLKDHNGKVIYRDFGELIFTHFGLSGPVILSASAHMRDDQKEKYVISIDLKPALDEKKLDARILRDFSENQNKFFSNSLGALLPRTMIPVIIDRSGIPPDTRVRDITKPQRRKLLDICKHFDVPILSLRPLEEAIVTRGGVKVSEVNPSTMASKLCGGLYIAGELLDVDAYTGGYNLQIAWATGRLAGMHAATDP